MKGGFYLLTLKLKPTEYVSFFTCEQNLGNVVWNDLVAFYRSGRDR